MRILFDSKLSRYKEPFGALREGERCRISLWIPASCRTRWAQLCLKKESGALYALFQMEKTASTEEYEIFSTVFSVAVADLYFYEFRIATPNEEFSLYRQGESDTNMCQGDLWQLTVYPENFETPLSLAGGVMYQIFPDRFFQKGVCDLSGKLEPYWIHGNKNDTPEYRPDENGEVKNCDFFGGNLRGIEEKLDYLKTLGVTILYLNPIFKAWSNHRYDAADYEKIDEMLGSEEDFKSLCHQAHARGMKVILDGVFSHTGSHSRYFDVCGFFGNGVRSNPSSPYRSWYDRDETGEYTYWWGIRTLPCVNETDPGYLDYMVEGENSICARWLRAGADGWRLDVADELPEEFLRAFRRRMKKEKPGSFLLGEVWEDASNKVSYGKRRRYFSDGELDSVMNYPFRDAVINFVTGKDRGEAFRKTVMDLAENYPPQVLPLLMNFLSTHDTPRILSVLGGNMPDTKEARAAFCLTEGEREEAEKKLRLAAFLQFVLPGIPSVYYGDEIGMEGFEDPFCRRFFSWEKKSALPAYFASLARLRHLEALKGANVTVEIPSPGVVRLWRWKGEKRLVATANASDLSWRIPATGRVLVRHGAAERDGRIELSPMGFLLSEE